MFAAAVVWSTPSPRCARNTAGRRSSTRLTNIHSRGRRGSGAVDLRRTQHGDGHAAVEQDLLRRDLVRAVAFARAVVAVAGRSVGCVSRIGPSNRGGVVGVRVVAGGVDVDRLARDHHRRRRVARERQEQAARPPRCRRCSRRGGRLRRRARRELIAVGRVGGEEAAAGRGDVVRHVGRVAPVTSTRQPGASRRRAVARPTSPVPPTISARFIAPRRGRVRSCRATAGSAADAGQAHRARGRPLPAPDRCRPARARGMRSPRRRAHPTRGHARR